MISDPVAVFFALALVVYLSIWLSENYTIFKKIGAAVLGIILAMILSNIGLLPGSSSTYTFLVSHGVNAAVVLILISVDIESIKKAGPQMLKAFSIGTIGSIMGAIIMALFLSRFIGEETWKLCGQLAATFTGGGMNFAAVGQALETSSDLFTAALAADVILASTWLIVCMTLPVLLSRWSNNVKPSEPESNAESLKSYTLEHSLFGSGKPVLIKDVAILASITFGSIYFSELLSTYLTFLPQILWLTTIVLLLGQIKFIKQLSGSAMIGNYFLLLFLASNGARSVVANIINVGPAVFYYVLGGIVIHGIFIFVVGRLFRIDIGTLAIASQANIGGSASAMALASARGYTDRILPGIAARVTWVCNW